METVGHHRRTTLLTRRQCAILRCQQINLVHLLVDRHRARPALGSNGIDRFILAVYRLDDGQRPIPVGTERQPEGGICLLYTSNHDGADELVFLDITASSDARDIMADVVDVYKRQNLTFDPIVAMEDVAQKKPAPDGLLRIAAANPDAKLIYVGDSIDDARSARAAKVPFIGIAAPSNPTYLDLVFLFQEEQAHAIVDDINYLEEVFAQ